MTPQELIQEGLEASKDEATFRKWAGQWFPRIDHHDTFDWIKPRYPFEVWAFRAREVARQSRLGWHNAMQAVHDNSGQEKNMHCSAWFAHCAMPYHWVIAGCAALEMQKESK